MKRSMIADLKKGEKVLIKGWVDVIREHGKLIFLDIRDLSERVQCVVVAKNKEVFEIAKSLSKEYCVAIMGEIGERPKGTENKDSAIGDLELRVEEIEILNTCPVLPFDLDNLDTNEDIRLKYRYLDLRRPEMQKNLILRGRIIQKMREYLYEKGFTEFETPLLAKSTPEGARDYIVPSRTQAGKFFALPQSPQLFKQLLMVGGMERYFQIAKCLRDEDLRSDRQPEFTQLDAEMSFVDEEDVYSIVEGLLKYIFKEVFDRDLKIPFQRLPYDEAMKKHNSDKPDLRKNKDDKDEFAFAWIVDFPLLAYDDEEKRYVAAHHPFCMPRSFEELKKNPDEVKAKTYDLVLNGVELLSGSIRIHRQDIQEKVFELLKIGKEEQREKFGFLLDALSFGAPPHGGFAIGLDRLIQILVKAESIREIIAFPKNKEAKDLMLDAPSFISDKQLKDVFIKLDLPEDKSKQNKSSALDKKKRVSKKN